jgi:hypothetical protein
VTAVGCSQPRRTPTLHAWWNATAELAEAPLIILAGFESIT